MIVLALHCFEIIIALDSIQTVLFYFAIIVRISFGLGTLIKMASYLFRLKGIIR